jgi:hypothetical protein
MLELQERNYEETRKLANVITEFMAELRLKAGEGLVRSGEFPDIPVNSLLELAGLNTKLKDRELFGKMVSKRG